MLKMLKPDFKEHSLVLIKDGRVLFSSDRSGLRPLFMCVERFRGKVKGCTLHDKVIGLAAARLIVYSGAVSKAITPVMSAKAKELLEENMVCTDASAVVERILNREKTGQCPMEERALGLDNKEFFTQLKSLLSP